MDFLPKRGHIGAAFVASHRFHRAVMLGAETEGVNALRGRTFVFVSFEKRRFTIGVQGLATEPTTAYQALSQQLLNYYVVPNNQVTSNLLASGGLWPEVALTGGGSPNNFASSDPEFGYSYNGLVKVDHKLTDKNSLSFHWFAGQGNVYRQTNLN
jgi:hypothetical protein